MKFPTLLLEIILDLSPRHINNSRVLHRRRDIYLLLKLPVHRILQQLTENTAQSLAASGFGDHAAALNDAAEGRNGAYLSAD